MSEQTKSAGKAMRNALLASAQRLSQKVVSRIGARRGKDGKAATWTEDAWEMYGLVGELRFGANAIASRVSQARLFVAELPDDAEFGEPKPLESTDPLARSLDSFAPTPSVRAQLLHRAAVNLFIPGEGWLVGVPQALLDPQADPESPAAPLPSPDEAIMPGGTDPLDGDPFDLTWRFLSSAEVSIDTDGAVTLAWEDAPNGKVKAESVDDLLLLRVWRPHPRVHSEADSPTRSNLPVLRELVGLTMHVSAQVDSRLAGSGVLFVRQSIKAAAEKSDQPGGEAVTFEDVIVDAMIEPLSDRSAASAVAPLVVGVPDAEGPVSDAVHYQEFTAPLDSQAKDLRDEALRRLALGLDMPPELLLGAGDMNHWGAWLMNEDTVKSHVEPVVALLCDALTTDFLWPLLEAQGMDPERARRYVVWYSVEHLIARPNKVPESLDLFDRDLISGDAVRDAAGFSDDDAPPAAAEVDPAVQTALDLVKAAPSLMQSPGLPVVVEQLRAVLSGDGSQPGNSSEGATGADADAPQDGGDGEPRSGQPDDSGGVPSTSGEPVPSESGEPALAAAGVTLPSGPVGFPEPWYDGAPRG